MCVDVESSRRDFLRKATVVVGAFGASRFLMNRLVNPVFAGDNTFPGSGNVGIGTTSPDRLLTVNGVAHLGNDVLLTRTDGFYAASFTIDNSTTTAIAFQKHGGGNMNSVYFLANYTGFGTLTPAYTADVAGSCHATSFPTSSDVRFKEEIAPIDDALKKIMRLNGVYFKWNELHRDILKRSDTATRQVGLVAQQVREVIPEIVSEWANQDYLGVDYGRLVAVMIEAIKELATENKALQEKTKEIEKLQAQMAQIEQRLNN